MLGNRVAEQFDPKERILKHMCILSSMPMVVAEQFDPKERILKQLPADQPADPLGR